MVWNKNTSIRFNPKVLIRAKQLFYDYIPTNQCNDILKKEFNTKVRANVFWRQLFSNEERKKHKQKLCSQSKIGNKNPMKNESSKLKSKLSHKGQSAWNKGLKGKEFRIHYPNGIKGGGKKGFRHSLESRIKMSKNMKGKKHPNYNPSLELRQRASIRMQELRHNFEFNKKMFQSLNRSVTNPHRQVKEWIDKFTSLKTSTNFCIKIGKTFGSIDEAEPNIKIAFFIDGNYWHDYPNLRKWDKCVNSYLQNRGWKVLRFWESDIKKNPAQVIQSIKNYNL
jgi:very-short-patch-repair endonuclease